MATETFAGPIDYVVFAAPRSADLSTVLQEIFHRATSGSFDILDLACVTRSVNDTAERLPFTELTPPSSFDLSVFSGVESHILDAHDLDEIAASITSDEIALVVVYEDRSFADVAAKIAALNGRELWAGGVSLTDLEETLTDTEKDAS